jgi:4-hydroxymandelate synthase
VNIQGIDHIEFCVADMPRTSAQLCETYGFRVAGQTAVPAGAQTVLLARAGVRFLLTSARSDDHPAAQYVRAHGDGVATIAFRVADVRAAFAEAIAGGATAMAAPVSSGPLGTATVSGFGDVTHKLVERPGPDVPGTEFVPGLTVTAGPAEHDDELFDVIDHVAVCLPAGAKEPTVRLYHRAFGLSEIFGERIEVGGQAMLSTVVQDAAGRATFTLIEPDTSRAPGQIDEFVDSHGGAGVQHVALLTRDIAQAVGTLSTRGVEFLSTPDSYYDALESRLGALTVPVPTLRKLDILADRDRWGEMFQIFTRSTHERRTFFFELIERRGALTFGTNNIQALYEAVERQRSSW